MTDRDDEKTPHEPDESSDVPDSDGDVCVFKLSKEKELVSERNMELSVQSSLVVANDVNGYEFLWPLWDGQAYVSRLGPPAASQ